MRRLGLECKVIDAGVYDRTVCRFRDARIAMPTFAELADPDRIPGGVAASLAGVEPDAPDPRNLFRVHWYNGPDRWNRVRLPEHLVLPKELTGVDAPVVIALGDRFPMIHAHKVLAAYGCLAPRIITGQFDPTAQRAVWPSTGNFCRGGVAISRIMGCRGVAVLPEGMSRERFAWLEGWVADPADIIRTPGTESNVKEIYDRCAELERDPANVIFNQFSEFGNYLAHYLVTGWALGRVFESLRETRPDLRLAAFTSATGSAGTIGAGDYLKERFGARIVAGEALECPTMLRNGFGEHNIQGIGDKHIPLIHNVMNTDLVVAISDRATDRLLVLFNTDAGRRYLAERRGAPEAILAELPALGISSICNILMAIKTAMQLDLGPDDVVMTVATDGAAMYGTEVEKVLARDFPGGFDPVAAAETFGEFVLGAGTDDLLELTREERERVFNLGYYTWVEQQDVSIEEFEARREQRFWTKMRVILDEWDVMIGEFNGRTGARPDA
ncbi:MAG: pyridoxal-5'-phosphate-dependent protein subunit beta [Chloroflexi bacterium GWC2_73_18]|nr:MAG: pyridoxal-5'-phosphate-dependent protein subunit beta [Chloroflexi bacterium GWC2_73_18]